MLKINFINVLSAAFIVVVLGIAGCVEKPSQQSARKRTPVDTSLDMTPSEGVHIGPHQPGPVRVEAPPTWPIVYAPAKNYSGKYAERFIDPEFRTICYIAHDSVSNHNSNAGDNTSIAISCVKY